LQRIDKTNKYLLLCDRNNSTEFPITNHAFMLQQYDLARPSLPWFARAVLRRLSALIYWNLYWMVWSSMLFITPLPSWIRGIKYPSVLTFGTCSRNSIAVFFVFELHLEKRHMSRRQRSNENYCQFEFTKQCLVERYKILSEKIDVIYIGYGPEYGVIDDFDALRKVKSKYNLTRPFLYFPAATWPHKNHKTLLSALKLLKDKHSFDDCLCLQV